MSEQTRQRYTRRSRDINRRKLHIIQRRADHISKRLDANESRNTSYDLAEMAALEFAVKAIAEWMEEDPVQVYTWHPRPIDLFNVEELEGMEGELGGQPVRILRANLITDDGEPAIRLVLRRTCSDVATTDFRLSSDGTDV